MHETHVLLFVCVLRLVSCMAPYGLGKRTSTMVPWETSTRSDRVAADGRAIYHLSQQHVLDTCCTLLIFAHKIFFRENPNILHV